MKNILEKVRALSIVLFSIVLAVSVLGCPSDSGTPTSGTTFQSQIDAATPGSTVTLNTSYSGSSITINKALTVNGNGIENLSIYVNSSVANNVTLRNFRNANVTVASSSRRALDNRMARAANDADEPDHFKKMGEDALQLKLEGCEITKFDAEADVALFLESGDDKKSEIEELNLKAGVEEFTFIEMDKADKPETTGNEATPTADKSSVGELKIEGDDIGKINLIGGKFDEVSIPDDFAGSDIDFKYDKEFDDQFGEFDGKDAFFGNEKIDEKDVSVVELDNDTASGSGVYQFSIPVNEYMQFDGRYTVVFMTDAQVSTLRTAEYGMLAAATVEHPVYAALPTGAFRIDFNNEDKTQPFTIFGGEDGYIDYGAAHARGLDYYELQDIVVLENYRNYNKDAFIAEIDETYVTIYVNMAEIRKADIVACAFAENAQYGEAGSKMAEFNLEGYKPYLSLNWDNWDRSYKEQNPEPVHPSLIEGSDYQAHLEEFRQDDGNINWDGFAAQYPDDNAQRIQFETDSAAYEEAKSNAQNWALDTALTWEVSDPHYAPSVIQTGIPYGNALKLSWEFAGTLTLMSDNATYPDVSNVVPTLKRVEGSSIYREMVENWSD